MLVSYQWLNEFLDLTKITPQELADKMSTTGIEVEAVHQLMKGLKKIVVGFVKECLPHPDSDHLSICQVDVGENEDYQIVCGAPNIKADIKVIVALPGARIANNFKIKKGKIRGVESKGMICSLSEIGFNEAVVPKEFSDGIYYLPNEAPVGEEVYPILGMDDPVIELAITPNRADALSMRGVAYEVGAIYGQKPQFKSINLSEDDADSINNYVKINVESTEDTPTYLMRIIKNVKIAPSPFWLQKRLMLEGIRPINNVVDLTNYILLLYGQPLHAFDYQKLASNEILVRRAQNNEKITTLDSVERELTPDQIVITNGSKPVALAGIMGGENSEIDDSTTTIALEAATFNNLAIRKTAQKFNLRSEASNRYEKGINLSTIPEALDAAAALIAELAGGTVVAGVALGAQTPAPEVKIEITLAKINASIGTDLSLTQVNQIFADLGFTYQENEGTYLISIPPRRWDLHIEADIIEEVARIYGYDKIPATLPSGAVAYGLTDYQKFLRQIREIVESQGFSEAITYALTTEEKSKLFAFKKSNITKLDWPMSMERSALRLNLISGLLQIANFNLARKNHDLAFYELGRVFLNHDNPLTTLPTEEDRLGLLITGNWQAKSWQNQAEKVDFFQLKGILEKIWEKFQVTDQISYQKLTEPEFHPGRSAKIFFKDQLLGFIGQVHPKIAREFDLGETYVLELSLNDLFQDLVDNYHFIFSDVTKFPAVTRDLALLVDQNLTNQEITTIIKEASNHYLQNIQLFDVYQGDNLPADKKSLAYSLTFVNPEATLTDEEIENSMNKIERNLVEKLAATIR